MLEGEEPDFLAEVANEKITTISFLICRHSEGNRAAY